jgi:hypothetical protein
MFGTKERVFAIAIMQATIEAIRVVDDHLGDDSQAVMAVESVISGRDADQIVEISWKSFTSKPFSRNRATHEQNADYAAKAFMRALETARLLIADAVWKSLDRRK